MSRAAQLSTFIKSAASTLSPRVRHLSLSALQSSAYHQGAGGFRAQYGGVTTTSSAANIFSDWSQEPSAQTLVPFVVEQSVSVSLYIANIMLTFAEKTYRSSYLLCAPCSYITNSLGSWRKVL